VNGISATDEFVAASEIAYNANVNQSGHTLHGETNLDWDYKVAQHECDKHLKAFWTNSKLVTASSPILPFSSS
jgi:hypothetical protein